MEEVKKTDSEPDAENETIEPTDTAHFSADIKRLIDQAEDARLNCMKQYESRSHMAFSLGLLCVILGSCAFGWFFFYKFQFLPGLLFLALGIVPYFLLSQFKMKPLQEYELQHKNVFMPKLAKALGGLKYRPKSGIKAKMMGPAKILPAFDQYIAEDCFAGTYKEIKMILSEARLSHSKRKDGYVFDGIFVLLELPADRFKGHTIITADHQATKQWKGKRWKDLQQITINNQKLASTFEVFSDAPQEGESLASDEILEHFAELSVEFDKAPLSVSFYRGKYIFIMIPYEVDMFETSNLYLPVTTSVQAQRCKKEIEQILSIIDLLSLYKPKDSPDKAT
ncbi:MAG: hypothetical protein DHS20C02_00540 [Micavibrio sp.]|nr:MAG: hypothetical protein DHS20C02_00540 [Micavibrio sp.]